MEANRITVHVADDHKMLIDGIIAVLKTETSIEVVGYSLDGQSVLNWFKENQADILILDIGMPVMDGLDVLRSFQSTNQMPNTIVLTSYNELKLIKEVLKLGAKGFITKVSAGENIIEAIQKVHNDELYFSNDIRSKIVDSFTGKKVNENPQFNDYFGMLSEREFEFLKLVAQEHSIKEIADILNIAPTTAETHKKNIMNKLGVKNALGLAIYLVKNKIVE
jgi:DNA-binding NarL/FixJ family response regulator